ncbi:MAG: HPr family phosphocarrier protein [Oscillospiraceae bacterium]|jgi:phosphocarrier protein|nr:HPr family phosphocarrier protein [Oscillospiraceae bacterium]
MLSEQIAVANPSGLHMRPASLLMKAAMAYKSSVLIEARGKTYNAKSLVTILSAAVKHGETIGIIAEGEDEAECMAAVLEVLTHTPGEHDA